MNKLKVILKKYQKLSLLLSNTIGKKQTFHHKRMTGRILSQTINQLLLIYYMCLTILKKIGYAYKSKQFKS